MAPLTAPGIDLQNLSSNWKALKATLPQNDISDSVKRKADREPLHPQTKKSKQWEKSTTKRKDELRIQAFQPNNGPHNIAYSQNGAPTPSASLAIWAADNDIPIKDLTAAYGTALQPGNRSGAQTNFEDRMNEGLSPDAEAGKYIAIDCEMVGVGPNPDKESALARVSVVNYHGHQIYDSFVQTKEPVTDYRTYVSGITPTLMKNARTLEVVQADVAKLLKDRILIGHSLKNDLSALLLGHPKPDLRDTSKHPAYRALAGGKTPGLKKLASEVLGIDIQGGEHSSLEDARATMLLYRHEKPTFELDHVARYGQAPRRKLKQQGGSESKVGKKAKKKKS